MKKISQIGTDYLFSTPSFLTGLGSVFNISGNYYEFNESESDMEADAKAIYSDWKMIGMDIEEACKSSNAALPKKS